MIFDICEMASPIGDFRVATSAGRLCALGFVDRWTQLEKRLAHRYGALQLRSSGGGLPLHDRLRDYFAGDLAALDAIAVDPVGTPFQLKVWTALRSIGPGRTVAYGDLARAIGAPAAVRAVGAANGANPICIVIPCHRVIGADRQLTGYGGGLERKRWLLQHEGALFAEPTQPRLPARRETHTSMQLAFAAQRTG